MDTSTTQSPPGAIGGVHESLKEMEKAYNKVKAVCVANAQQHYVSQAQSQLQSIAPCFVIS
jgi:hypothetical protein